jgi:hypothetical protein
MSMSRSAIRAAFLAAALLAAPGAAGAQESFLHHSLSASLVVADREPAADRIAAWVEQQGGWFVSKSGELVVARLPNAMLKALRELLERQAEEVVELTPRADDLREQMLAAQAGLRSREEILARNLAFFDRADVAGTLAIEKEVSTLMQEIEALKGRLQKLETDRVFARVEIHLAFLEHALPERIPSSFAWINDVGFASLMGRSFK